MRFLGSVSIAQVSELQSHLRQLDLLDELLVISRQSSDRFALHAATHRELLGSVYQYPANAEVLLGSTALSRYREVLKERLSPVLRSMHRGVPTFPKPRLFFLTCAGSAAASTAPDAQGITIDAAASSQERVLCATVYPAEPFRVSAAAGLPDQVMEWEPYARSVFPVAAETRNALGERVGPLGVILDPSLAPTKAGPALVDVVIPADEQDLVPRDCIVSLRSEREPAESACLYRSAVTIVGDVFGLWRTGRQMALWREDLPHLRPSETLVVSPEPPRAETNSVVLDRIEIGSNTYELRSGSLRGKCETLLDDVHFVVRETEQWFHGRGGSQEEAVSNWKTIFHAHFQRLWRIPRGQKTPAEQDLWAALSSIVDVAQYEAAQPIIMIESGMVSKAKPWPVEIAWAGGGRRESVDPTRAPGGFIAMRRGEWFEALVQRDRGTQRIVAFLDFHRAAPVRPLGGQRLHKRWQSLRSTTSLPDISVDELLK